MVGFQYESIIDDAVVNDRRQVFEITELEVVCFFNVHDYDYLRRLEQCLWG